MNRPAPKRWIIRMWNPWEWLKAFYEAAGHKQPVLSACGLVILFALIGLAVWWRLDSQYRKDHPATVAAAAPVQPPPLPPEKNTDTDPIAPKKKQAPRNKARLQGKKASGA